MAREESYFDELARGLAEGSISRGKALRLMGGALVGGVLASIPGMAGAAPKCPGCPATCNCVRDSVNHVRACVSPTISEIKENCDLCPEGDVCHGHVRVFGTKSVRCSAPCTTTSSTTSTSTTTPTTSTSTSTTSTSTTTMCQPNGGTCSTGGTPCCSGNCTGGFCCESGRVGLSNGTCAKPCSGIGDCPGCSGCVITADGAARYCVNGNPTAECPNGDDRACPQGQFCIGPNRLCIAAC